MDTEGREKLVQLWKIGLGNTLSFFSFQLNSHQNFHRKKASVKKICEKINNAPKNVICASLKRTGLNVEKQLSSLMSLNDTVGLQNKYYIC